MVVHQVVSETTPYQIQKKFYILGKFLLRKSYWVLRGHLESTKPSHNRLKFSLFLRFLRILTGTLLGRL